MNTSAWPYKKEAKRLEEEKEAALQVGRCKVKGLDTHVESA